MKTTNKFARLISATEIKFAPTVVVIDGQTIAVNPDAPNAAEIYARCSPRYLPVVDAAPSDPPREGYHYAPDGWEEREGAIRRVWREETNPPPRPRRWTRLDILTALGESDMFDAAVAYLNSIEVKPHITAWLGLNTANYIEEGYPDAEKWNALLDGAAQALGKTREEIDAFLANIPTE